ncbi:MAG TPA: hypothetical protein VJ650_01355 [Gemmatimonadaceae bacterium]|nr:hypothetical protein [Gemmatimonadaceae bacterium]
MTGSDKHAVALSFGGLVLRFASVDPELALEVHDPHARFLVASAARATCDIECAFGDPTASPGAPIHGAGTPWELRRLAEGHDEVTFYGAWQGGMNPWLQLVLAPGLDRVKLLYRPYAGQGRRLRVGFPVDEYLVGRLLGSHQGVILHAASIVESGRVALLLGHSGAGKSTLAEIAAQAGAEILSDDRTIIRTNGPARAWGTPWHGSYKAGSPRAGPIGAVFLLVQSTETRVVALTRGRAFQEVYVRVIQPTVDAEEIRASVEVVERLIEAVPVFELHFRPDRTAFEMMQATMRAIVRDAAVESEVVASKLLDGVRE